MKKSDVEGIANAIVVGIRKATEQIEERLAKLEQKPHVKFCGVHESGKAYQPGDACTHGGSLWICVKATSGEPNKDFIGWKLAVKRGHA